MVKVSAFHCAVSAHSLKEEEEGAEHGHRGSKHPQGRLSVVENHSKAWRKRGRVAEIVLTLVQNSWKVLVIIESAELMVRQQNLYVKIGYEEHLRNFAGENKVKNEFLSHLSQNE